MTKHLTSAGSTIIEAVQPGAHAYVGLYDDSRLLTFAIEDRHSNMVDVHLSGDAARDLILAIYDGRTTTTVKTIDNFTVFLTRDGVNVSISTCRCTIKDCAHFYASHATFNSFALGELMEVLTSSLSAMVAARIAHQLATGEISDATGSLYSLAEMLPE